VRGCEIAIDAPDGRLAESSNLSQKPLNHRSLGVIRVNQNGLMDLQFA